jgi:drug/metabolite transporter (DMT)-like permease
LAVRFSLAFIIMAVFFFRHLSRSLSGSWRAGLVVGLALAASYITQTVGMQTTNASKAAFITGLSVILVPIFSAVVNRQLPPWSVQLGAVSATVGLTFLSGVLDTGLIITAGDTWVTACAIAFALHILATGRYASKTDIAALTTVQFAVVALSCWAAGLNTERWPGSPPWSVWMIIIFLATIATCGAFVLQTWAQKRLTANRAAIILTMEPAFATIFGYVVLGERLTLAGYLGCALIVGGTLVAELGPTLLRSREKTAAIEAD